jgi:perosamine synthetase
LADIDLSGNERAYVNDALDRKELTYHGSYVKRLERDCSRFLGLPAIACSSGTAALHLALLSLGIGAGDEVIVPDLTFGTTASAVRATGATPVLVDIHPDTWGLDPQRVAEAMSHRVKAIIPVHLLGMDAGDFTGFGVQVIEDCAEAFGMVKPRGDLAAYSLYANKVLTCGEGGILSGNLGNTRLWRDGGFDADYCHSVPGLNYRITNLQAAVACAQLERVDQLLQARLHNASRYASELTGKGRWLFAVEGQSRPDGLETRPMFYPLHLQPAFRQSGNFPVAEQVWRNHYLIPTGPHVDAEEVIRLIWRSTHMRGFALR